MNINISNHPLLHATAAPVVGGGDVPNELVVQGHSLQEKQQPDSKPHNIKQKGQSACRNFVFQNFVFVRIEGRK